jgi:hypothetical protein
MGLHGVTGIALPFSLNLTLGRIVEELLLGRIVNKSASDTCRMAGHDINTLYYRRVAVFSET